MNISTQQKQVLEVQLRQDLVPMIPFMWVSVDEAFDAVRNLRENVPFISSGPVQATRSLMHASFLFALKRNLDASHCSWRRRYDVDELVLPCDVVLRVNKVDHHGNRCSNRTRRCINIHQGALIPDAVEGVKGFATLGYALDELETQVSKLKISWTSGTGERVIWTLERPDSTDTVIIESGAPDSDPDDIVVKLKED